jgi:hypothetical protein
MSDDLIDYHTLYPKGDQGEAPASGAQSNLKTMPEPRLPKYWDTGDVAKGSVSGVARGVADIFGLPKDVSSLAGNVFEYGVQKGAQALGYNPPGGQEMYKRSFGDIAAENERLTSGSLLPSSEEIKKKVFPDIMQYKPSSQWGERAQAGLESAVANAPGGASTMLGRMIAGGVGGIAGQTVRQSTEGQAGQGVYGVSADLLAQLATGKLTGFRPSSASTAQRELDAALAKDFASGQAKVPQDQLKYIISSGAPVSYADIGGPNVQALLNKSMSRISETHVPESVRERNESLNPNQFGENARLPESQRRIQSFLDSASPYGSDPVSLTKAVEQSKKAEVNKIYGLVRDPNNPAANSIYHANMPVEIRDNPHLHEAMADAAQLVKGELDPTMYATPHTSYNGYEMPGNISYWDLVKRSLDKKYNQLVAHGNQQDMLRANQIDDVRSALKGHLDSLVPQYKEARGTHAYFSDAGTAPEAGMNFFKRINAFDKDDAFQNFRKYDDTQKNLFKSGFVGSISDEAGKPGGISSLSKKFSSDMDFQDKAKMVLGDNYNDIKTSILGENIYNTASKMAPASGGHLTMKSLAGGALAGGAPAMYNMITDFAFATTLTDPKYILLAVGGAGVGLASGARAKAIAQRVADYAARGDLKGLTRFAKTEPAAEYLVEDMNRRFQALNQQGQPLGEEPNREERASGGRTGKSASMKALRLIDMVDHIRKDEGKGTSSLLNLDDTTVAKALAIANKHI